MKQQDFAPIRPAEVRHLTGLGKVQISMYAVATIGLYNPLVRDGPVDQAVETAT
jgi:hypothetical protein